jgi:hypothetical protein
MKLRAGLASVFMLMLSACTFHPNIISASVNQSRGEDATVSVLIRSKDAETIKHREIYFSAVVINCSGIENGYPIEPYIMGEKATQFKFPTSTGIIQITGTIPVRILREYNNPCLFLRGGSYIYGKIASSKVQLVEKVN